MFKKILIANRGEIAVRILRACRELGIRSVAVFSEVDRKSLHVRLADEAYPIGPAPARESYLNIDKIIAVAKRSGADAIHPGYGFLAENAALPRACTDAGITFIGPTAQAMEALGAKTAGRQIARRSEVPTVPGTNDPIEKPDEAHALAQSMGFPVLLKAVAGGGGKGMRLVRSSAEFASAYRDASSEALNAFGDPRLYLEKYLEKPHHVEIQILADHHGRIVSLGERECSVQRRHQKVIEEAPSPIMTPDLRKKMGDAAVRLARAGGYTNAGTVEFLVDSNLDFYFLEVNTRLQVEHPVTEQVTGLDLVKLQIAIAAGHRLPFAWETITPRGNAMEVRLYAEDPDNNFFPSPGKILVAPGSRGPRHSPRRRRLRRLDRAQRLRSTPRQTHRLGQQSRRNNRSSPPRPRRIHRLRNQDQCRPLPTPPRRTRISKGRRPHEVARRTPRQGSSRKIHRGKARVKTCNK